MHARKNKNGDRPKKRLPTKKHARSLLRSGAGSRIIESDDFLERIDRIMKTTVLLLRHAQSEGNLRRIYVGHSELPLTPLGLEQAKITADFVAKGNLPRPDVILSSDLVRAIQTALPTALALGLPILPDPALREIYSGCWEGKSLDDLAALTPECFRLWREDPANSRPGEGESMRELYRRIGDEFDRVVKTYRGKTVLLVTHATPIRCLHCRAVYGTVERMAETDWFPNASFTVLTEEDGVIREERGGFAGHLTGDYLFRE